MDTKPKDRPTDFELEQAIFEALHRGRVASYFWAVFVHAP